MTWQALALSAPLLLAQIAQLAAPAPSAAPKPSAAAAVLLQVGGEVPHPLRLTAETLASLPRTSVHAKDHDGKDVDFSGVALAEMLKLAGVPTGAELKGPWLARYVVASAEDGYRAVFALPELSHDFKDAVVLLADLRDGKPISSSEGPLRLVVPGDKRLARWVRQVLRLTVRSAPADDPEAVPHSKP